MQATRPPARIVVHASPRTEKLARGNKGNVSGAAETTLGGVMADYEASSVAIVIACDKYPAAKTLPDLECAVADGRLMCRMLCGLEPEPQPDGTWESPDDGSCGPAGGLSQGFRKVFYLENGAVTKANIETLLTKLMQLYKRKDARVEQLEHRPRERQHVEAHHGGDEEVA